MDHGAYDGGQSALKPLRSVGALLASLRSGAVAEEEVADAVARVADAVERSLRRLLRDQDSAALQVRLRALDADELRADEVLSELRQHERISMELGASVHDLLRLREQLSQGGGATPGDARLAVAVADRLEHEIAEPVHFPRPAPSAATELSPVDETLVHAVPVETEEGRRGPRWVAVALAGVLLLAVALGVWQLIPRGPSELDQGVALFRSGNYMDAAPHFWRYAEAHPDDPTPHLYLARIHRRLKRYHLAGPEMKKALQLAPEDPNVQTEAAFLLLDTGRYDPAVEQFRRVVQRNPEFRSAWVGLILSLRASGRTDAADRALASAPPSVRALMSGRSPATPTDSLL